MNEPGPCEFCVDDVLRQLVVAQQAQGRAVSWEPSGVTVVGRADDLAEAVHVLLDNAAKHGRAGTRSRSTGTTTPSRSSCPTPVLGSLPTCAPMCSSGARAATAPGVRASASPSRAIWWSSRAAAWCWTTPPGPERRSSSAYWRVRPMTQAATARGDLRILIVEDHVLFAESLELALTLEGYDARRVPVPTEERGAGALVAAMVRLRPRVVLLDLDLGGFGDGVRLIPMLAKSGANVVVVTASNDRGRWGEAIWQGARKVLPKSRPLNEILAVVRKINHNLPVMSCEEREELLAHWRRKRASGPAARSASRS